MKVLAWALPAQLTLRIFYLLAQIRNHAKLVMWFNFISLGIKILLSWLLIYGHVFWPPMGAIGTAMASLITAWISLPAFLWYVYKIDGLSPYQMMAGGFHIDRAILKSILRIGIPAGTTVFAEDISFTAVAVLVVSLGTTASGAHQIVANLAFLLYFVPVSLANACSIMILQRNGANQWRESRKIARHGIYINILNGALFAVCIYLFREQITQAYSSDPEIQQLAVQLLVIVCIYHFFDGQLVLFLTLLRCWNVSIPPMLTYIGVLFGIGLGGGWWLAYHLFSLGGWAIQPMGVSGFWIMETVGVALALIILLVMFKKVFQDENPHCHFSRAMGVMA
ncbi:multidrug resistance protein, MATE family [Gammaproteobacteria bacterium]